MKQQFIEVNDNINDKYIINISQIAMINEPSGTVFISSTTGEGHGIIHITEESMKRLVEIIKKFIV